MAGIGPNGSAGIPYTRMGVARLESEVKKLQHNLDHDIVILVCTYGNLETRELVKLDGISVTTLKDFRQKLENLTTANMI